MRFSRGYGKQVHSSFCSCEGSERLVVCLKDRTEEKVSEEHACGVKAEDACDEFHFNTLFPSYR